MPFANSSARKSPIDGNLIMASIDPDARLNDKRGRGEPYRVHHPSRRSVGRKEPAWVCSPKKATRARGWLCTTAEDARSLSSVCIQWRRCRAARGRDSSLWWWMEDKPRTESARRIRSAPLIPLFLSPSRTSPAQPSPNYVSEEGAGRVQRRRGQVQVRASLLRVGTGPCRPRSARRLPHRTTSSLLSFLASLSLIAPARPVQKLASTS